MRDFGGMNLLLHLELGSEGLRKGLDGSVPSTPSDGKSCVKVPNFEYKIATQHKDHIFSVLEFLISTKNGNSVWIYRNCAKGWRDFPRSIGIMKCSDC